MKNKIAGHAPGPWRHQLVNGDYVYRVYTDTAVVAGVDAHENMLLIEAAPELLAALEKLEARLDWFLSDDFSEAFGLKYKPLAEELSELEQARAAIAKAKGAK